MIEVMNTRGGLWYLCQRYNLKANHNQYADGGRSDKVVVSMSKIQSESKSQLLKMRTRRMISCGIYVKDTI